MKVRISERALIARINRKLKTQDKGIRISRPMSGMEHNCGRYYVLDWSRNMVVDTHVDIEKFARDIDVMAEFEEFSSK